MEKYMSLDNVSTVSGMECKYSKDKNVIIVVAVTMALVATFTVTANVTIIVAMARMLIRDARRGLGTLTNSGGNSYITRMLMLSLAVCGVLVGGFVMPLSLANLIGNGEWTLVYSLCTVRIYSDYMLCAVVTLHVVFMAADTYLLVCRPFLYRRLSTHAAYVMISVGWALPLLITVMWGVLQKEQLFDCVSGNIICNYFSSISIFNFIFGAMFFILFIIVILLYLLILRKVRNLRKWEALTSSYAPQTNSNDSNSSVESNNTPSAAQISIALVSGIQESRPEVVLPQSQIASVRKGNVGLKCFRFVGAILWLNFICWVPAWIVLVYSASCFLSLPNWVYLILDWLTYFSCTVNPVLYCCNRSVQRAVTSLLCPRRFFTPSTNF